MQAVLEASPIEHSEKLAAFHARLQFVCIDQSRNRYRFYTLVWQPSLFGGGALIRLWGRLGRRGRSLMTFYADRETARPLIQQLVRRRLRHGYHLAEIT
jgi:predicted DNA-binding WGR domain protein